MAEDGLRAERKIVSVLFADLVGFTSRAEALDPEDVEAILAPYHARLRGELERRGGTVEKFIGDAVMALFGAPFTHEDDAERAVRAAIAIRDWARDDEAGLQIRIAVTTGETLVKLDAQPAQGQGMAAGDVVNIAARLQVAAPVNGLLVDGTTFRLTDHAIEYRQAEPVVAKGKRDPIPVWEVVQARSRLGVDVIQSGAPLVGREREVDLLRGALDRTRAQREPQLVTLVGVPGIGKSRLVYELLRMVDQEPELITWRQGRSLPYGDGVTFWALSEMVKAQAGILDTDTSEEAGQRLSAIVAELAAEPSEAAWIESNLKPLVGLASDAAFGGDRLGESFEAWTRFFEAVADRGAAVLVFEDLHWADDDLLDFVDHLADWATDVPLLLVGTARPELLDRRPGWGGGKRNATTLSLSPLSDGEIRALIEAVLRDSDVATDPSAALLSRAGGNPLYAEQFARMLLERQEAENLPLPETVHGIIAARLDALATQQKRLLQDASVLGKVFWVEPLVALGGGDRASLEEHLHALGRKEFVRRTRHTSVADEVEYAFAHALVRDVAYGQVPRRARAEKHLIVARWLEGLSPDRVEDRAEMLAHHYVSALDLAEAAGEDVGELRGRARHWLTQAGDRAFSLNALPAAARSYGSALRYCPEGDTERPDLLLRLGRSRPDDPTLDDAVLIEASEALTIRGDRAGAAEAEVLLAFTWWVRGSRDRLVEHLERARSLVEEEPASPAKAHVLSDLARSRMLAGDHRAAVEAGREAMGMAEALGLKVLVARILCTIGTSRATLGEQEGIADLERSISMAREIQSLYVRWNATVNLATVLGEWGELDRIAVLYEDPAIRDPGNESDRRWVLVERANYSYHAGDWEETEWLIDAFEEAADPGTPHYMEFAVLDLRARLALARGAPADALEATAHEVELTRAIADPQALLVALGTRSKSLREVGRVGDAEPLVDEILAKWRASDVLTGMTAALDVAWTLRELGRESEMLEILDATGWRSRWFEAAECVLRGELVAGAEVCQRIGSLPEEAETLLRTAEELPLDDPERSEHARRALNFYRRVRASALIRRSEASLTPSA
jgi:class 3 adenylate cyclase/tetratricopeptide (TPR) repeat protein